MLHGAAVPRRFPCRARGCRTLSRRAQCSGASGRIRMDVSLAGRTAVITGGSKGIGFAIAKRFATSGAEVAIVARGREALDDAVKTIGTNGRRVVGIQGDVARAADVKRAYDEIMKALGKIDIVVNNAGTSATRRRAAAARRLRSRALPAWR